MLPPWRPQPAPRLARARSIGQRSQVLLLLLLSLSLSLMDGGGSFAFWSQPKLAQRNARRRGQLELERPAASD